MTKVHVCVLGNTNTNTIYKSTCIVGERKHNDGEDVTKPVTAPTLENKHHKNNINQNLSITTVNKDTSVTYFYQNKAVPSSKINVGKLALVFLFAAEKQNFLENEETRKYQGQPLMWSFHKKYFCW